MKKKHKNAVGKQSPSRSAVRREPHFPIGPLGADIGDPDPLGDESSDILFEFYKQQRVSLRLIHGTVAFGPCDPNAPPLLQGGATQFGIRVDGTILALIPQKPQHLRNLIQEVVERAEFQACSMAVMLAVAHYLEFERLPSLLTLMRVMVGVAGALTDSRGYNQKRIPTTQEELRVFRRFTTVWRRGYHLQSEWDEFAFPWATALVCLKTTRIAWMPEGEIQRRRLRDDGLAKSDEQLDEIDYLLAGIGAEAFAQRLGFTLEPGADPVLLWQQWHLIDVGPTPIPEPWKVLGRRWYDTAVPDLSPSQRDYILGIIESCIAQAAFPSPRYLGHEITVPVPRVLQAHLEHWGIYRLTVVPHRNGLWCLPERSDGPAPGFWWSREAPYITERAQLPQATNLTLAGALAALWHDLCAEAITIERRPDLNPPAPKATREPEPRKRGRTPIVVLPPVRYVGQWSTEAEQEAITHIVALPGKYRPLPRGWRDRIDADDFQKRQDAAAKRAAQYGFGAPPPGFTFVKPHERGQRGRAGEPAGPRTTILSRGLLSISLGLSAVLEQAARVTRHRG